MMQAFHRRRPRILYVGRLVGIDLAGSARRPTGIACLEGKLVKLATVYGDEDVIKITVSPKPRLVAIDAPLTPPRRGPLRDVDRMMRRLGFPVLPPGFPGMRQLTARGMILAAFLEEAGVRVIEIHPKSTLRALARRAGVRSAVEAARWAGLRLERPPANKHEEDAILALLTAVLYLRGEAVEVRGEEGCIVLPRWDDGRAR